jgi:AcrR family transcriptional regulator
MSLYYHVAKKDDVLDGIADVVAEEINEAAERVESTGDWKTVTRGRILAARAVMLRHPWAPAVFETRTTTSPAVLRYYDRLVGLLREGGFSNDLIHRALHALGSRALGFTQELFDPEAGAGEDSDAAALDENLPSLASMMAEIAHDDPTSTLGWCDAQAEFEFALDLLLDGLDRVRTSN